MTGIALAIEYGLSLGAISHIAKRRSWNHPPEETCAS